MKKLSVFTLALLLLVSFAVLPVFAAKGKSVKKTSSKEIVLNAPDLTKGKTVLQAMKDRHSSRDFADKALDAQTLSELLWAAGGITREDGRRTFPTAMNCQEIDIYAFMKDGVYLYVPQDNKLVLIIGGDKRAAAGKQEYAASAAVNLVYVSDMEKMRGSDENQKLLMTAVDLGHISENVYLYCSSEDLACVVRAFVDESEISKLLNLKSTQRVILSQSVGYKK
jgi:Nitroreductase